MVLGVAVADVEGLLPTKSLLAKTRKSQETPFVSEVTVAEVKVASTTSARDASLSPTHFFSTV